MEAASVPAPVERSGTKVKKRRSTGQGTPWWIWIAVFAIVVFCLFPFYWLVNTSLKTGPDLSTSSLVPPSPTLDNYDVDLLRLQLHASRSRTARSWRW